MLALYVFKDHLKQHAILEGIDHRILKNRKRFIEISAKSLQRIIMSGEHLVIKQVIIRKYKKIRLYVAIASYPFNLSNQANHPIPSIL